MPQYDRFKNQTFNIDFITEAVFERLRNDRRSALVFLTSGTAVGRVDDKAFNLAAPAILWLSEAERADLQGEEVTAAQAFLLDAAFLASLPPTALKASEGLGGVCRFTEEAYPQLYEWFFILGAETMIHSDGLWVCRVKRYLIQLMRLLDALNRADEASPLERALDYLHLNYSSPIRLADLTKKAYANRIELNSAFKARFELTAMGYLHEYRLRMATELLIHTDLSVKDIAEVTGFESDSYFAKRFKKARGLPPAAFREQHRVKFISKLGDQEEVGKG